jgi:membrane protease YdiL (CAAX protease family)
VIGRALTHPIARIVWGLPLVLVLYLVAQSVAGVGAVGALAGLVVERKPPARYGLVWHDAGWGLIVGVLLGAAVISVAVGLLALVGVYRLPDRLDAPALGVGVIFYLQVAVGEEIMFRGIALRALDELGDKHVALALSAVLFLFYHSVRPLSDPAFAALILAAGVAFGAAYLVTRALWLPIAMHWAFDTLAIPVFGFGPGPASAHPSPAALASEEQICAVFFRARRGGPSQPRPTDGGQKMAPTGSRA